MMNLGKILLLLVISAGGTILYSPSLNCSPLGEFSTDSSNKHVDYYLYAQNNDNKSVNARENQNATDIIKPDKQEDTSDSDKTPDKARLINIKSDPTQFCMGKYKKQGDTGYELITVRCPEVGDTCICEIDMKKFTEFVECGGSRKSASKGSEIRDCDSLITGN